MADDKLRYWGPVVAFVAAILIGGYLILNAMVFGDSGKYVAYVKLDDAGGILKNYTVKVGNVSAGSIERISLDDNDDVILKMELDDGVGPIGPDATANVRPVNLLGEKYVDLDVGNRERGLPSGSMIPKDRTGVPTELDDVLNALDPGTRTGLRLLINEAGLTMAGRGADFNTMLSELPPALDEAKSFVADLERDNQALESGIVRGDRVVASMHSNRDDLGELVESAGNALDAVADRRGELASTLQGAPSGLSALNTTLGGLRAASGQLTPAVRDVRKTSPSLAASLRKTPDFAADAEGTLKAAREASPALSRLGTRSIPTLKRLQPTAARLSRFADDSDKLLDAADQGRGLREFIDFMDGWAGVIENKDGLGHVFRIRLTVGNEILTSAIDRYVDKFGSLNNIRRDEPGRGKPATPETTRAPESAAPTPGPGSPTQDLLDKIRLPDLDDLDLPDVEDLVDALGRPLKAIRDLPKTLQDVLGGRDSSGKKPPLLNYLFGP